MPHAEEPVGAGAVVLGAVESVRSASTLLRPWHPTVGVNVLEDAVDGGDAPVDGWLGAGAVPIVLGHVAPPGVPPLLKFDAHAEPAALRQLAVEPERSLVAGIRGPQAAPDELDQVRAMGFEVLTGDELRALGPGEYSQRVLTRTAGAPCFLSFDVDVIDPAFAPAVSTPEVAGLLPHEAITLLRSLAGTPFSGFQLVGLDAPDRITSVLAANLVWEMLALRLASGS